MTSAILKKELTEYLRDRRFLGLGLVLLLLLAAASLDGWNRAQSDAEAREAAVAADREVWVEQGANNPHGAAHFARYAFRPTPALAAFDPGVFDYAGAAFWMEAHTQNPTTLRRAEDAAIQAPFPSLSPAWIIQTVGTLALAVLLFSTVAGERERGTLKALSAIGVSAGSFSMGKASAILVFVAVMAAVLITVPLLPAFFAGDAGVAADRTLSILLVYVGALLSFSFLIFWLSARARSTSAAFKSAAFAWLFLALLWPTLAGQTAITLYPDIDEQELKNDIQLQAQTPFWVGEAREPAVATLEAKIVNEFNAESFESLGFDSEALVLQAHEEFANGVYDRLYGELNAVHSKQDAVLRYASLVSPVLALQRLSSGLAGTDLLAQQKFAYEAEQHRRLIIEQLNRDMMVNAGDQGFAYMADRTLWEVIPDFEPQQPSLAEVLTYYRIELFALIAWLFVSGGLAVTGARRALERKAI